VRRGDLVLASAGSGDAGKPRPVLVVQDDALQALSSVVVCPLSTRSPADGRIRIAVSATSENGLATDCVIMTDKVTAVPTATLDAVIGSLTRAQIRTVNQALGLALGFGQPAGR
jgi:mRNA interferase MazF